MSDPLYRRVEAFFDSLVAAGVCGAILSPGSRSTPLTIAAHRAAGLPTWVVLDERSAGFLALGMARMTGRPAVLVCTSGTAAANYLPAVIEANHSGVPLIVCTADRPPELREWGAGQTISQNGMYGPNVRWSAELPVAPEGEVDYYSAVARRSAAVSTGAQAGPVHLNWPFREPFDPLDTGPAADAAAPDAGATTTDLVESGAGSFDHSANAYSGRADAADSDRVETNGGGLLIESEVECLRRLVSTYERGIFAVGPIDEPALAAALCALAERSGWPVIADPASQLRSGPSAQHAPVVAAADVLLKSADFALAASPDVVVRVGDALTSKPFRLWIERNRPSHVVLVDPRGVWHDPSFVTTERFRSDPVRVIEAVGATMPAAARSGSPWSSAWSEAEAIAQRTLDGRLHAEEELLEAAIARTIGRTLVASATVIVANSMPIRDFDSFLPPREDPLRIVANRGASGIDGLVSMAIGAAAVADGPVVLYAGDLTVLHDVGALFLLKRLGLHLTVVVPDNDGGGIFSFLPIADRISDDDFDRLFHTPTGFDLPSLDGVGGVRVTSVREIGDLEAEIRKIGGDGTPGVDIVHIPIDRQANIDQHRALTDAVAEAVAAAGVFVPSDAP